jgi:uncharacterized protein (UPF0303 family)
MAMNTEDHQRRAAEIQAEETRLSFAKFDFTDAWAIGRQLVASAPAPVAIRIVLADRVLFAASLDGTSADNALWLDHKLNAVKHFGRSSLWLHHNLRAKGRTLADIPAGRMAIVDHGGGFPIRIGTQTVGAIGVSGLPHEEDHRLIVQALSAVILGAEEFERSGASDRDLKLE